MGSEVVVGSGRVGSEASPGNPVSFPGKHPPPSDPEADLRGQPTPTPRRPDPTPWPKTESRRVTLECQTLKVREPVRRSFVTDLPEFRHLFIRKPVDSVNMATGSINLRSGYSRHRSSVRCGAHPGHPFRDRRCSNSALSGARCPVRRGWRCAGPARLRPSPLNRSRSPGGHPL